MASSYGAPEEVAGIYRAPRPGGDRIADAIAAHPAVSTGRALAILADPRAYAALFYMLLSLATGVFYFSWVAMGASLSLGLSVVVIGIPFVILYFGSVRLLSLVEGDWWR